MSDAVQGPSKLPANPADRLREAADVLDEDARYAGDNPGMASWAAQNFATAVVLRAVADDLEIGLYIVGAESPAAALALAATILGSE